MTDPLNSIREAMSRATKTQTTDTDYESSIIQTKIAGVLQDAIQAISDSNESRPLTYEDFENAVVSFVAFNIVMQIISTNVNKEKEAVQIAVASFSIKLLNAIGSISDSLKDQI